MLTVGRIVHYHPPKREGFGGVPLAAVVVRGGDAAVNLWVFPNGDPIRINGLRTNVPVGDWATRPDGGFCCFPPREPAAAVAAGVAASAAVTETVSSQGPVAGSGGVETPAPPDAGSESLPPGAADGGAPEAKLAGSPTDS